MGQNSSISLSVIGTGVASLFAGSVGSAVGTGVAYPLDVLKTKAQTSLDGLEETGILERIRNIYANEGICGFYGGVRTTMIGKAVISGVSFGTNKLALSALNATSSWGGSFSKILLAACIAGFVAAFLVLPVDRVKIMMQAQDRKSRYSNELECLRVVIRTEGWIGLFTRGLGPTMARELPTNAIYFVVFEQLMQTSMKNGLGPVGAPFVCGAISGCACWIPVYPIDCVNTRIQNAPGEKSPSARQVALQLYKNEGVLAFYRGLPVLLIRAALSNGVTFLVHDSLIAVMLT
jgi:hypothetical protein